MHKRAAGTHTVAGSREGQAAGHTRVYVRVDERDEHVSTLHANKYAMRGGGRWRGRARAGCNNRPSPVAMVTPSIP